VPGGTVNARAVPFTPSVNISSSNTPASGHEILLPSEDAFIRGLADLSISPQSLVASPAPGLPSQHISGASVGESLKSSRSMLTQRNGVGVLNTTMRTECSAIPPGSTSEASGHIPLVSHFASDWLRAELRQRTFLEKSQLDTASASTVELPQVSTIIHAVCLHVLSLIMKHIPNLHTHPNFFLFL
jgi:hypothetical protein